MVNGQHVHPEILTTNSICMGKSLFLIYNVFRKRRIMWGTGVYFSKEHVFLF